MNRICKVMISAVLMLSVLLASASCGELKVVEKSELGLNFVIPESFERTGTFYADIEYGDGETAFFADAMHYSELELTAGATVRECTEKILDNMQFGGVTITYDDARGTASFDTWASDAEGTESYYNYITVLLGPEYVYVARYVCPGTEKAIEKHTEDFAEMSSRLSARQ